MVQEGDTLQSVISKQFPDFANQSVDSQTAFYQYVAGFIFNIVAAGGYVETDEKPVRDFSENKGNTGFWVARNNRREKVFLGMLPNHYVILPREMPKSIPKG